MPRRPHPVRAAALPLLAALLAAGCTARGRSDRMRELERAGLAAEQRGAAAFAFDDFGGLSGATLQSNALPYRVVAAALLLDREAHEGRRLGREELPAVLRRFGFLSQARIANWPGGAQPGPAGRPLGLVTGPVRGPLPGVRIETATLGCAACHAGTTYDAAGLPTGQAWLGLPNTSLNVDAYTRAVYGALKRGVRDPDALARRTEELFPEMGRGERFTLRRLLLPRVRSRMAALAAGPDAPTPIPNGGAGRTNGVGALKVQLGLLDPSRVHPEVGFTSIPELSSRGLRSSLLYDGVFAPPGAEPFAARGAAHGGGGAARLDSLAGIVAFFTVPTMGMPPEDAERAIPRVREAMGWLDAAYAPPPFPGPVDEALARGGGAVFAARCAGCHGRYDDGTRPRRLLSFPNRLVPQAELGTDPARWQAIDTALMARLQRTAYRRHVAARRTGGYVAPILSGLWATAPYLHNGSVPTLRHLLEPASRPTRFQVGGHRLDFARVGIAGEMGADGTLRYPAGYRPWADPETYDTRAPGLSNAGHERQVAGLPEREKEALLEYLKGL